MVFNDNFRNISSDFHYKSKNKFGNIIKLKSPKVNSDIKLIKCKINLASFVFCSDAIH